MAAEEALVAQHKTAKQQTLLRDTTLLWAPHVIDMASNKPRTIRSGGGLSTFVGDVCFCSSHEQNC